MHLLALNITDLVLGLLQATIVCDSTDDKSSWIVELCAIVGVPVTASSHNFAGGSLAVRLTDAPIGAGRSRAISEL